MNLLIVNADDFGLNDATTDAIAECHAVGSVTSATMMVNTPATERAAAIAAGIPALGVGLHFNLTWGRPSAPLRDVGALVDADGCFLSRGRLARRLLAGRVPRMQVERELDAQLARIRALGIQPSHVDSHQHVHAFGIVFDAVASRCRASGIPMRVPWVATAGGGVTRFARRALLKAMVVRATRRWRGWAHWNAGLGSVFDLAEAGAALEDDDYRKILPQAPAGAFELMVHPVNDGAAMEGYTAIGAISEVEFRYLSQGTLAEVARSCGFVLGSYRDLIR